MNALLFRGRHPALFVLLLATATFGTALRASGDDLHDWTGTWETNRGTMNLVQTGNSKEGAEITGKLALKGAAAEQSIVAIVLGSRMSGTWSKDPTHRPPDDRGDIDLIMSDDRVSFTGAWRKGHGPEQGGFEWRGKGDTKWDGEWTGKRVGGTPPAAAPGGKRTAVATANPSVTDGSVFKSATFTIGGTQPQTVTVTQPAENFSIKSEHGKVIYQVTKGKSWGSLTLAPGTYILSCNGGGAMGLMSASVSIEYDSGVAAQPTIVGGSTGESAPGKEKPGTDKGSAGSTAPAGGIVLRSGLSCESLAGSVVMQVGEKAQLSVWARNSTRRGTMHPVTADRWSVGKAGQDMGSIDEKTGEFTAGPKEGDAIVTAAVGEETGTLRIMVTSEPPVIFAGRVELFDDQHTPLPIPPGGVEVTVNGAWFDDLETHDRALARGSGISLGILGHRSTDLRGRFTFTMRPGGYMVLSCSINGVYIPAIPNHEWSQKLGGPKGMPSDLAEWRGALVPGVTVPPLKPDGFPCLQLWLEEIPVTFSLGGVVSHHGKPVRGAIVELRDAGTVVEKGTSNSSGKYRIDVSKVPAGSYRLTSRLAPDKTTTPHVTVDDWLYITKDIPIVLPPQDEKTVVDIRMISFKEKIGYKGP